MTNKEMFFISGAWNTGIGFVIHGYNFIISTVQVVGFEKTVLVRNEAHKPHQAKVLFVDYSTGLAFIEKKVNQEASLDILSFELAVIAQNVTIYKTNYYNKLIKTKVELLDNNIEINNIKYLEIKNEAEISIGEIALNRRLEFVGITTIKEDKNLVLPAKYILKVLEEYSHMQGEALRCPLCLKVVQRHDIIDSICPVCSSEIIPELLNETLPSRLSIDKNIESVIENLGFDIKQTRLGQHFWEIIQGSATIFVRYEPKTKFIVAFSALCKLTTNNNSKVYDFLMNENLKLEFLSFSIDKNRIFLSAPYIIEDTFDKHFANELFKKLFEKSDYYDDILLNLQK